MQMKILLNIGTIHKQIYKPLSVSASQCITKNQAASFKISEKSGLQDKEEIK